MSKPAAKQGDKMVGTDTHILMVPAPGGPVPTPTPMPFDGTISSELSADVFVDDKAAATDGSKARNTPHVPTAGPFQKPPADEGKIIVASRSVLINDKPAARDGDIGMTCNDPADLPNGTVVATGTVLIGD